jgi:hypothetical protein
MFEQYRALSFRTFPELAALLTIAEADVVTANPAVLPVMVVALRIFGAAI